MTQKPTNIRYEAPDRDEHLFERACNQWQFGDWSSLSQLAQDAIQNHPERARLALFAAAGRLQIGAVAEAKSYIDLAKDWGIEKRLVLQLLTAGIHNSLGRAAAIAGDAVTAVKHFEASVDLGIPESDRKLVTRGRIDHQCSELGVPPLYADGKSARTSSAQGLLNAARGFNITQIAEIDLGEAWSANTINTAIFRHHGILTHAGKQLTAFYADVRTLRVVQRDLESNRVEIYDLIGEYNLRDAHNSISIGVDRASHLHICYDQHASQLRYRRSIRANDITGWTNELSMTGNAEGQVTYATFVQPRQDFPLTLLYRDGVESKGVARLKTYDETSQSWADHQHAILSGSDSKPWTSNAYWNHPAIGRDGSLHVSFVWRTHAIGEERRINNVNIDYARSPDNGVSWTTSKGRRYRLPITQVNAETVCPVSPGSNLINQCSMALDSSDRPHIVFYSDDPDGVPQYQHLRYDGKQWHHQFISRRTETFSLEGRGTLQIPISRPEIVIDHEDNVYVISRGDHSHGRMVATFLAAPHYIWNEFNSEIIWDDDLGYAEPVIDRVRWEQDNILSLLIQHNEQPDHDVGSKHVKSPIRLLDIQFLKDGFR
jgi:hypothetical protein